MTGGDVHRVRLRVNGTAPIPKREARSYWVGLVWLAYAEATDIALRTAIMEGIALETSHVRGS